jgi:hypothetical protein
MARRQRNHSGSMTAEEHAEEPQSNLERLQGNLKEGSLAERLIAARIAAGTAAPGPRLRKVISDRLEELKREYESVPDQQD